MNMDDDDDDNVILSHYKAMAMVATVYMEEELVMQKKLSVLALCQRFGISSNPELLTGEAVVLFYDLMKATGHDWRGSVKGKAPNIERGRDAANQQLIADYFLGDASTYSEDVFRRRFRMGRPLFMWIVEAVTEVDPYFSQRPDATGKLGAMPLQKVTAAMRMLAYRNCANELDEWICLGESTFCCV